MVFVVLGAVVALLGALITLRAKARHDRAARLIHQTPVTPIADLVESFTAQADAKSPTYAAVQGCVVARETTRLTAPITGSSCVAYAVRVFYDPSGDGDIDVNYIEDSKWVPWAVDDGTGLALAPFNPFEPPKTLHRAHCYWPGTESTGDTFKDNTPHHACPLDRVISHYGYHCLPADDGWGRSHQDLSWEVSILKEFGNEVFLLGPYTVQEGCAHFQLDSDSVLCFGSRADVLSHEQLAARSSARWAKIWFTAFVILGVVMFFYSSAA